MTSSARLLGGADSGLRWAAILVAVAVGVVAHPPLFAQGTQPLHKTDMIRLLTAGGLSTREIADLVRRNCLAFQPTARDRADLQTAGADAGVLAAVDQCARRRSVARAGGGATATLHVVTQPAVSAPAGTDATITARLFLGPTPAQRVELRLKGTATIPGGLTEDALAYTDPQGVATWRVPTGTKVGTYRLSITQATGVPIRVGQIDLTTTAARELQALALPSELVLAEGSPAGAAVRVTVTDVYGNPAAGVPLRLGPVTAAFAGPLPVRTTDERGQASFPVAPGTVRRDGQVAVLAGDARIGSFTVRLRPLVLSEARTQFVAGADQHAVVGTSLALPLGLEVRDTAGAVVPGQSVAFSAVAGTVTPAAVLTDSAGSARVRVIAGDRAGPVVVTAKVGSVVRSATVYADPGVASELVVLRDTAVLKGQLVLLTRRTATLRVIARDRYGNATALGKFTAVATGQAIRLKTATQNGAEGVVTFEPRQQGSAALELRGSQLEARVPVQVAFPVVAETWVIGARGSWAGFTYDFTPLPYIQGRPGVRGELFAGRSVDPRLRFELTAGLGSLNADSATKSVSVALTQVYARAEYAVLPDARVVPVVSAGAGLFRVLSNDPRQFVHHNSVFWLVGVGADVPVARGVMGEIRIETHQLNEITSSIVDGHVGSLIVVEAGVRLAP